MAMITPERQIEETLVTRLRDLKYEHRSDIRDRAALEANFREKFEALNRVKLTNGEFQRLLDEIVTPDVYEAARSLRNREAFILKRNRPTGGYLLAEQFGDTPQFYHVAALADLWLVAQSGQAKTFHFNILRTILEKTALFLGHNHFSACIKAAADDGDGILHQRFVDLLSHGKYSMYEPTEMGDDTKEYFLTILRGFVERHPFNRQLLPEPAVDTETV